ncbi:hypothetical protein [Millisia brevis]|uniref:hypothetical protein n=1 Tax=Millisia brevis TaxID=264148 RepID=UPI00082EEC0A|nr:hypothetical protein [Millisia brevis]
MNENEKATATGPYADISALIEASSLGTAEARSTREAVSDDEVDMILRLAEERRRTGMVGCRMPPADRPVEATAAEATAVDAAAVRAPLGSRGADQISVGAVSSVTVFESARETVVVTTVVTPKVRRWRLIGSAEGGAPRTVRVIRSRRGSVVRLPGGFGVPAVGRLTAARLPVYRAAPVRRVNVREIPAREALSGATRSGDTREGHSLVRGTLVRGTCDSMRRHWYVVLGAAAVCALSRFGHREDPAGDAARP